eukprot:CCRYP_015503-RA/>CCRYP_015503-RA protein AED:0.16 eAED:0.20 QI:2250/0.66/0.75/1/0/0/4/0/79
MAAQSMATHQLSSPTSMSTDITLFAGTTVPPAPGSVGKFSMLSGTYRLCSTALVASLGTNAESLLAEVGMLGIRFGAAA